MVSKERQLSGSKSRNQEISHGKEGSAPGQSDRSVAHDFGKIGIDGIRELAVTK